MTVAEIIAELEAINTAGRGADGWATMEEMHDAAPEKSRAAIQKMVKAAVKAGRMEAAFMPRPNVVGNLQRIIAYRIKPT